MSTLAKEALAAIAVGLIAMVGIGIAACAPVGEYEIRIKDKQVSRRAVYGATDWINRQIDCDLFVVLPTRGSWWTWARRLPRRGVITVERNDRIVHKPRPSRTAHAKWGRGCNRGRVFLDSRSWNAETAIAHELGHIACLEHKGGTFMAQDIAQVWLEMDAEQRAKLKGRCGQ